MAPYEDAKGLVWDVDEKVINFVFEHRTDPSTTKEQIVEAYEAFKKDYQNAFERLWSKN